MDGVSTLLSFALCLWLSSCPLAFERSSFGLSWTLWLLPAFSLHFFSLSFFVFLFSFTPSLSRAFAIHYSLDATTCSGATETTASPTSTCGERDETAKPGALSSSLRSIQQTNHHKRRPSPAMSALEQLLALGIPEAKATYALDRFNGRIEHASDWVFGDVSESDASLPVSPMTSFLYPSLCSPGRRMGATHPTDACSASQSIYVHDDRARPTSFVNRSSPPPHTPICPPLSPVQFALTDADFSAGLGSDDLIDLARQIDDDDAELSKAIAASMLPVDDPSSSTSSFGHAPLHPPPPPPPPSTSAAASGVAEVQQQTTAMANVQGKDNSMALIPTTVSDDRTTPGPSFF